MTLRAYGRNGGYALDKAEVNSYGPDHAYLEFKGKKGKANAFINGSLGEIVALLQDLLKQAQGDKPQPDLEMLRVAVQLMDKAALGESDTSGIHAMTDDEILNAQAAARANVAQFIIEADPMGLEAAERGLAQEIAGTEVEGEKESLEEYLYRGIKCSGQAETAQFCDLLEDMRVQMEGEGESQDAIREHLLGMADEFIETAQAFKKYFGGAA